MFAVNDERHSDILVAFWNSLKTLKIVNFDPHFEEESGHFSIFQFDMFTNIKMLLQLKFNVQMINWLLINSKKLAWLTKMGNLKDTLKSWQLWNGLKALKIVHFDPISRGKVAILQYSSLTCSQILEYVYNFKFNVQLFSWLFVNSKKLS